MTKKKYAEETKKILQEYISRLEQQDKEIYFLLASRWEVISNNLEQLIIKLSEQTLLTENELYKLALYKQFLMDSREQVAMYSLYAEDVIAENQALFGKLGLETVDRLSEVLEIGFNNKLPVSVINNFVGLSADGSKLSDLLFKSYPETIEKIKDVMLTGISLGDNPLKIAREMKALMDGNLTRAMVIARTETMYVYRETTRQSYIENKIVKGINLVAEPDACNVCLEVQAKNPHPLDYPFDELHPNCRCAFAPVL